MANQTTGAFKEQGTQKSGRNDENLGTHGEKEKDREGVTNLFEGAKRQVQQVAGKITDSADDYVTKAKDVASEAAESMETMMKDHPARTFLIGLGLGAALGMSLSLIRRGSK